jgi:hypothetical protein
MADFFRAFEAVGTTVPMFFIESTAPNNVDDYVPSNASALPGMLQPIVPADAAVTSIAQALANSDDPNLVVMVHGFNNPRAAVLKAYVVAARAIEADGAIKRRKGLVCVGYRWPSEHMGQPMWGTFAALPTLPIWVLVLGAIIVAGCVAALVYWPLLSGWWHVGAVIGLAITGLVVTAGLLRVVVYFRDIYRATNYGVPDLIQILRAIDAEVVRLRGMTAKSDAERRAEPAAALGDGKHRRVELSFIGHSMGGFVVTNTIRALTDAFASAAGSLDNFGLRAYRAQEEHAKSEKPAPAQIGNVFKLVRFVLASPDIPAEHLLSSRSNFLASALVRFDEAYLFSSEGDEVLRQISTLANYFSYPTKSRKHGFRLGNVDLLSRDLGVLTGIPVNQILSRVRVGKLTLQELYDELDRAAMERDRRAGTPRGPRSAADHAPLPRHFSYFDCTDYRDTDGDGGVESPLLTFGRWLKRTDANARLPWYSHLRLLFAYLFLQKPNVHGGYFEGFEARRLMFRLACLGYGETRAAYGGAAGLSDACKEKRIRVLLSPRLPP